MGGGGGYKEGGGTMLTYGHLIEDLKNCFKTIINYC